jgi:hypothetical protein
MPVGKRRFQKPMPKRPESGVFNTHYQVAVRSKRFVTSAGKRSLLGEPLKAYRQDLERFKKNSYRVRSEARPMADFN